jgi:hypothetical protein
MVPARKWRRQMTASTLNNRTLADIIPEFFGENETPSVIVCDAGNGCAYGEDGRALDYDPTSMAHLIMIDIPEGQDRKSLDGFESTVQSEWQLEANGYRWRVRF